MNKYSKRVGQVAQQKVSKDLITKDNFDPSWFFIKTHFKDRLLLQDSNGVEKIVNL